MTFNPDAGPTKRLMLQVMSFQFLGSEGSSTFLRPTSIEQRVGLQAVMKRLHKLLDGSGCKTEATSSNWSHASETEGKGSPSSLFPSTQADFATQIYPVHGYGNAAQECSVVPASSSHIEQDLLSLLIRPNTKHKDHTREKDGTIADRKKSEQTSLSHSSPSTPRDISTGDSVKFSSELNARPNEQDVQLSKSSKKSSRYESRQMGTKSHTSTKSERGTDQGILPRTPGANTEKFCLPQKRISVESKGGANSILVMYKTHDEDHFQGMKRIPRSCVRISNSQQVFLESKDSWYQPEAGGGSSNDNRIPPEVLQDFRLFVDRRVVSCAPESSQVKDGVTEAEMADNAGTSSSAPSGEGSENSEDTDPEIFKHANDNHDEIFNEEREIVARMGEEDTSAAYSSQQQATNPGSFYKTASCSPGSNPDSGLEAEFGMANESVANGCGGTDTERSMSWPSSPDHHLRSGVDAHHSRDMHGMNLSNMRSALPSSRTDTRQASYLADLEEPIAQPKPLYNAFPSSSPMGEEDEMEIMIPHAVDDPVEETDEEEDIQGPSQEPPSTAMQAHSTIQVEQTPLNKPQETYQPASDIQLCTNTKRSHQELSSDPIVPGTYDPSLQDCSPDVDQSKAKISERYSNIATVESTEKQFLHGHTLVVNEKAQDEDGLADEQLFAELESSQQDRSTGFTRLKSTLAHKRFPMKSSIGSIETDVPKTYNCQPPVLSSSSHVQFNRAERRLEIQVASTKQEVPKEGRGSGRTEQTTFKRRRLLRRPSNERPNGDIDEIIRANRHKFLAKCSMPGPPELKSASKCEDSPTTSTRTPDQRVVVSSSTETSKKTPFNSLEASGSYRKAGLQTSSVQCDTDKAAEPYFSMDMGHQEKLTTPPVARESISEHLMITSAFDEFKSSYPGYKGSPNDLVRSLTYMEFLIKSKGRNVLRKSLWDDLIRIMASEHLEYLRENRDAMKEELMTPLEFFNYLDQDPVFKKRIVTPETLEMFLSGLDAQKVAEARREFQSAPRSSSSKAQLVASAHSVEERTPRQAPQRDFGEDNRSRVDDHRLSPGRGVLGTILPNILATPTLLAENPMAEKYGNKAPVSNRKDLEYFKEFGRKKRKSGISSNTSSSQSQSNTSFCTKSVVKTPVIELKDLARGHD
jgi:hypothetical protein